MELITKIVITIIVLAVGGKILHWTWTSHIDLKATARRLATQQPKIADTLVTRDPNKLYQNGVAIADVTGPVQINNGLISFAQPANVSGLDRSQPIEYQRYRLKVTQVHTITGMKTVASNKGSSLLQNVMEGVTCEVLR